MRPQHCFRLNCVIVAEVLDNCSVVAKLPAFWSRNGSVSANKQLAGAPQRLDHC